MVWGVEGVEDNLTGVWGECGVKGKCVVYEGCGFVCTLGQFYVFPRAQLHEGKIQYTQIHGYRLL